MTASHGDSSRSDASRCDGVVVRAMERADVPAVAAIEHAVSPEPWSVALFEGEFEVAPERRHWLVAVDSSVDAIVGFVGMMFVGAAGEGHLMNVAVAPDHRRRGIATLLCSCAFDHAADGGFDALTLEVRQSNGAAIELYRRFGFAPVGVRRAYYTNPDGSKEDGMIMWVHDNLERSRRRRTFVGDRVAGNESRSA